MTFQTFEVSIVVACLTCVPMLHSAPGSFVIFFRELRHQPYFHTPLIERYNDKILSFSKITQLLIYDWEIKNNTFAKEAGTAGLRFGKIICNRCLQLGFVIVIGDSGPYVTLVQLD